MKREVAKFGNVAKNDVIEAEGISSLKKDEDECSGEEKERMDYFVLRKGQDQNGTKRRIV